MPFDARWHQAVGRPARAREIVDPGPDQRECRLVVMRVTRLDDRDVDRPRPVALQACRHGNAGGAAADDQDSMVRSLRHDDPISNWPPRPGISCLSLVQSEIRKHLHQDEHLA